MAERSLTGFDHGFRVGPGPAPTLVGLAPGGLPGHGDHGFEGRRPSRIFNTVLLLYY